MTDYVRMVTIFLLVNEYWQLARSIQGVSLVGLVNVKIKAFDDLFCAIVNGNRVENILQM